MAWWDKDLLTFLTSNATWCDVIARYSGKRLSRLFLALAPLSHAVHTFTRRAFQRCIGMQILLSQGHSRTYISALCMYSQPAPKGQGHNNVWKKLNVSHILLHLVQHAQVIHIMYRNYLGFKKFTENPVSCALYKSAKCISLSHLLHSL
jgi:hypothetical protein